MPPTAGYELWFEHPALTHRIIIVVDELLLVTGAATKDEYSSFRAYVAGRLTELAAASRSCGMHLIVVTQYGIAQAGGASGSLMRFNLSGRMVVGASSPDGLKAAFDEPVDPRTAAHLPGTIRGRCLYGQLNAHHGHQVTPGQLWHMTQPDAEALAPSEPAHPVRDFDTDAALALIAAAEAETSQSNNRRRKKR